MILSETVARMIYITSGMVSPLDASFELSRQGGDTTTDRIPSTSTGPFRQLASGIAVVNVMGSLDETNRTYFFDCISDLIEEGFVQIVVDCTGLGHISSSGLAGLLRARSQAQSKGGKIYLTHLESTVADVLTLTRLNMLLAIYPTTAELLERLVPDSSGSIAVESET